MGVNKSQNHHTLSLSHCVIQQVKKTESTIYDFFLKGKEKYFREITIFASFQKNRFNILISLIRGTLKININP